MNEGHYFPDRKRCHCPGFTIQDMIKLNQSGEKNEL